MCSQKATQTVIARSEGTKQSPRELICEPQIAKDEIASLRSQ